MTTYLVKRLLLMVPTLIGITMISFLIVRLAPGDPAAYRVGGAGIGMGAMGGDSQADREAQIVRAKVRLGLLRESAVVRLRDPRGADIAAIEEGPGAANAVAFSPDGALIAAGIDAGAVSLRDARSLRPLRRLEGHEAGVNAVAFSLDGALLASASDDGTARVWRVETGEAVAVLRGDGSLVRCVAFSPDGATVATGSRDRSVRLFEAATGREIARLDGHVMEVTGVRFAPGGGTLISASLDRSLRFWDVATRAESPPAVDCRAAVHGIDLTADGALVAAALSNNSVALVDAGRREVLATLHGHRGRPSAVAFSPDGERLASAGADATVRLWSVAGRRELAVLGGHTGEARAVAFDASGRLASGARDITDVGLIPAYGEWLGRLARLDFGRSFRDGRPVWEKIFEALPVTLELNLLAILVTYLLAIPLGVFSAARRDSIADHATTVVLFVLYSVPSFFAATLLIILLGSERGPTGGILPYVNIHGENAADLPFLRYLADHLQHLVLPLTALTYSSFAFLSRLVRASMLEELGQDAIRTARAKGLPEVAVVGKHALRNALIPVVTIFGNLLPALIGGSVIIERIYSLPGMGSLGFDAILQRDYPVVMGITTLVAVLTMVGILISDLLYCVVDPRISYE